MWAREGDALIGKARPVKDEHVNRGELLLLLQAWVSFYPGDRLNDGRWELLLCGWTEET
jgi:hypothetical protein